MSLRLEMLQVARLAPKLLGGSTELVQKFVKGQIAPNGGFKDRSGSPDLYYTVFGLDCLAVLQLEVPLDQLHAFVKPFGSGDQLDFVHLCCLARCWNSLKQLSTCAFLETGELIAKNIEKFRARHGGYSPVKGSQTSTVYANFLALGAFQDLELSTPNPLKIVQSLKLLETPDGAWANEPGLKIGSTNATAAAVTLLRHLAMPINDSVGDWLLSQFHPDGGFRAAPAAPIPDLLSTATALHALDGLERDFSALKEPCLDFIDTLWTNEGSFHGHWGEDILDCEYTFYGLLALGTLSL